MRILKKLLPLLVLLLWSTAAKAQYNPTDPPEPGVYFTLTTRIVPADGGYTYYGGGSYAFGSSVHLDVLPYSGYRFLDWEDEQGNIVSTERVFNYTMPPRDVTLTARFVYDPSSPEEPSTPEFKTTSEITFKATPAEGGYCYDNYYGYVYDSTTREYMVGETYRFSAYPNSHYRFVNWTRNGIEITTDSSFDYTVPIGDHTLVANFEYDPDSPAEPGEPLPLYLLKVKTNPEGAAYVYFDGRYYAVQEDYLQQGSLNRIRANASTYYHFVNWTDQDGNVVSETPDFDWIMPARHTELTANYTYEYDPSSPDEPGTPNPDGSIGENMVMWPRFGMYDDTHVQILCETPGATIHYTLDGSTPTAESPVYTAPVYVDRNLVVRAICLKEGMENSPVVSYQVTAYKVEKPVFTFENRLLKISSDTPDAIIRYTLDFTDPNEESAVYTAPFEPEENCRIKAYATKEGLTDSPISIYVFRRAEHMIPAPTFSMNDEGRLVITPAASGGQTFYTLDGTVPTASSTLYTEPLLLDGNFTVKAFTTHPAYYDSPIGEYVIEGFKVETPTATYGNLALTLATSTSGATIRYTFDGSIPSEESEEYSAPLSLTEDRLVIARGFKPNYEPSDTVSYVFRLAEHKAATPTLTLDTVHFTVSISCVTENAEIRYTIDGEAPTASTGTVYSGPVEVIGNRRVIARAFRSDLFPSEPDTLTITGKQVTLPEASFANRQLTLTCSDPDTRIYYTTDGSEPTTDSNLYEGPVALTENCTVLFFAARDYFIDSEIVSFEFIIEQHQTAAPELSYDPETKKLAMSCSTENAEIRYTVDGDEPTETTGLIYEGEISVEGNHTYTAKAFRSDLFPSNTVTVAVSDQKVAAPIITHSLETMKVTMTCPTAGAQIRYTTDSTVPTESTGTVYSEPIDITGNMTFTARAFLANYVESDVTVYEVNDMKLPTPTAVYAKHAVTLSCSEPGVQIRYTLDGNEPTSASSLYSEPIPMNGDCLVRFFASKTGYNDSDENSFRFTLSQWQDTVPTIYKDFRNRMIYVQHPDTVSIRVDIDGQERVLNHIDSIAVTPDMKLMAFTTIAANEDRYDSRTINDTVVFHLPPHIDFDGQYVHFYADPEDAMAEGAERWITLDMESRMTSDQTEWIETEDRSLPVSGFGTAIAHLESDRAFRSEESGMSIDYYNTGYNVGARHGHRIEEALRSGNAGVESYESLAADGDLTREDLECLGSLPNLTELDIETAYWQNEDCRGVFAGSSIETLMVYALTSGILEDMPRLTTVVWKQSSNSNKSVPQGVISEAGNPNLLLWVYNPEFAPADAVNVVTMSFATGTGSAERLSLQTGFPFNAYHRLWVDEIEVTKEFSMQTVVGECAGWDAITLPFGTANIVHETAGRIVPFSLWEGKDDYRKPFWLYKATSDDWAPADSITAGIPYIISMPNNPDYVDGFNLPGKVTFSQRNVTLGTSDSSPKATDWIDRMTFTGTFMPVEEENIRTLNVNTTEPGVLPGSAFTDEEAPLPFGAYVSGEALASRIPVFGGSNAVLTPEAATAGTVVETPAPGTIRVSAASACRVEIVTPDGATVRSLSLKAGETASAEGLTRGLYIVAGKKIMVK